MPICLQLNATGLSRPGISEWGSGLLFEQDWQFHGAAFVPHNSTSSARLFDFWATPWRGGSTSHGFFPPPSPLWSMHCGLITLDLRQGEFASLHSRPALCLSNDIPGSPWAFVPHVGLIGLLPLCTLQVDIRLLPGSNEFANSPNFDRGRAPVRRVKSLGVIRQGHWHQWTPHHTPDTFLCNSPPLFSSHIF